jgi:hypothetical protein
MPGVLIFFYTVEPGLMLLKNIGYSNDADSIIYESAIEKTRQYE